MSRLYALCVLALLVYGLVVGCEGHEHRACFVRETVQRDQSMAVEYFCACGRRPYAEVWR